MEAEDEAIMAVLVDDDLLVLAERTPVHGRLSRIRGWPRLVSLAPEFDVAGSV